MDKYTWTIFDIDGAKAELAWWEKHMSGCVVADTIIARMKVQIANYKEEDKEYLSIKERK